MEGGFEPSATEDASEVIGQMVVETAVVKVTILTDEAGQLGTSDEQARTVEVKVLKTVDVVIGTEVSEGLEVMGATTTEDDLTAEVVLLLVEGTEALSLAEGTDTVSEVVEEEVPASTDDEDSDFWLLVDGAGVSAAELVPTLDDADSVVDGETVLLADEVNDAPAELVSGTEDVDPASEEEALADEGLGVADVKVGVAAGWQSKATL